MCEEAWFNVVLQLYIVFYYVIMARSHDNEDVDGNFLHMTSLLQTNMSATNKL